METQFKIAVTYGGILGKFIRKLGYRWNHILLVFFKDGKPYYTYESNWRGVVGHAFNEKEDLAEEHEWYIAKRLLNELDKAHLTGYCDGARGKWYALHYWVKMGWRIMKEILRGPTKLSLIPAETCITFVDAACRSIGRPVSSFGAKGLPDDIIQNPYWELEWRSK